MSVLLSSAAIAAAATAVANAHALAIVSYVCSCVVLSYAVYSAVSHDRTGSWCLKGQRQTRPPTCGARASSSWTSYPVRKCGEGCDRLRTCNAYSVLSNGLQVSFAECRLGCHNHAAACVLTAGTLRG